MTNEEMTIKIQAGERDLLLPLWEQNKGFIAQQAIRRIYATDGLGGVDTEDLIQSGFFALLNAVQSYKPDSGYKFTTFLTYHLKTSFAEAAGYRSSKRDPLLSCVSLDTPLDDSPDADTLLDLQPDERDLIDDAEQRIWIEQLHAALDRAMQQLPELEQKTLASHYWEGHTREEVGNIFGLDYKSVLSLENKAINRLRQSRHRRELEQYIDDRTPYYQFVGLAQFNTTQTSTVERAVIVRERLREQAN